MTLEEIFEKAKAAGGVKATVDRFDDRFDGMTRDNSFNWCDDKIYPIFEIRQRKSDGLTFVWIANNQNCDPRCDTYLDENCFMFFDYDSFFDFIDEVSEEVPNE